MRKVSKQKRVTFRKLDTGRLEILFTPVGARPRDRDMVGWITATSVHYPGLNDRGGWEVSPYSSRVPRELHARLRDAKASVRRHLEGRREKPTGACPPGFYRELATRVLRLVNALQYENASTLLELAWSASNDKLPKKLGEASTRMSFAFHSDPYDHDEFIAGVERLEKYLEETG